MSMKTLADLFDEEESKPTPPQESAAEKAAHVAKVQREWQRGIEYGWYTPEGVSLIQDDEEQEDEET